MIDNIIGFSLRNRLTIIIGVILIISGGIFSASKLDISY